jgi:translocation and assembly module TamA
VGAAHGFSAPVTEQVITEVGNFGLPASERFFSGGDTSVRGFALDRLANQETIDSNGFPTGGNGVIVLNSELRMTVKGPFQATGFVDAGNVYRLASDLDFTNLRPAAGFGVMYRSPFGTVRVDVGFNLDPKEFVVGSPERRTVWHVLLGQPF